MKAVISATNCLWASIIKSINIDMFNKIIVFDINEINSNNEVPHNLKIFNFESYLWIEKPKEGIPNYYNFKTCEYYELTSISFDSVQAYSNDKWLKQYPLDFNIVMEIWESVLLVKSHSLIIDGVIYEI